MGKSIVWRTATRRIEFARTKSNELSMTIETDSDNGHMSLNLSVEDIKGIAEILDDHRRDIEWDLDHLPKDGEPKCQGDCGMDYCDENGCLARKRELVEPIDAEGKEVTHA
jgi:hypothetical protein